MADPRIWDEQEALRALNNTRAMYNRLFRKGGAYTARRTNNEQYTERTQNKVRYLLQQALIKRFRTWKAIRADRHVHPQPFQDNGKYSRNEVIARRELARARMEAPPVSHHKQPSTSELTFNAILEQPENVFATPRTKRDRTLTGRGEMSGGKVPFTSRSSYVRALLGANTRLWHTHGALPEARIGVEGARVNADHPFYRENTEGFPYDRRRRDYMTTEDVAKIADFKRRQNLYRYTANGGDAQTPQWRFFPDFDINMLARSTADARRMDSSNKSGLSWLMKRFRPNEAVPELQNKVFPFPAAPPDPRGVRRTRARAPQVPKVPGVVTRSRAKAVGKGMSSDDCDSDASDSEWRESVSNWKRVRKS